MDLLSVLIAKYLLFLPIVIGGLYFLRQPLGTKKQMLIFGAIAVPLIGLIALLGGHIYNDPRPFVVGNFTPLIPHVPDNGFPSDHTLLVSAIAAILYFFSRRLGVVLGVVAILIGMSRVYVGLHHPIDVLGSMVISVVGAGSAYLILRKYQSLLDSNQA